MTKDNNKAESERPAWNFTTNNTPPSTVNNRFPDDSAVVAYENIHLDWGLCGNSKKGRVMVIAYI